MGKDKSLLPNSKLLRALIYLPAKLYQLIVHLRVVLYQFHYLKPHKLNTMVISVGNITLGGTGKTPLVEYIARFLAAENMEVGILSRGYKRVDHSKQQLIVSDGKQLLATVAEAGDEPFMLAQKLDNVKVIVGADRYQSGQLAISQLGCEVLLLDDGFQHLKLARDFDLVVLDGTDPFGDGEMVPYGRLREPLYGLRRASAIVVTRADHAIDQDLIFQVLDGLGLNIPIIYSYHEIVGLHEIGTRKPIALRNLNRVKIGVLCALGHPEVFIDDLAGHQAEIVSRHLFLDHHNYQQVEIDKVIAAAQAAGAQFLVTTEKDEVKLANLSFGALPLYVVEIKAQFEDEVKLKSILLRAIMHKRGLTREQTAKYAKPTTGQ
jgi:tetraacyldisaccharide 4'-kinase